VSANPGAVFLSYASQDSDVARRMADALRAAGVDVWFDQSELRGGETWDHRIRRQIKECALFLPVISAQTQARREGYFRLEWKLAEERTHLMAKGTPFLVPVSIDATNDRTALVPDSFLTVQWARLTGGETPPAFCAQVKRLLMGGGIETAVAALAGAPPRIPDYELLRLIGQGSYGDVWLARGVTGIYRAIKVVWRERFADAGPFEREFHGLKEFAAISLGESIQLALLHIGRNDEAGFFYYVMELADDAERGREIDPPHYVPLTLTEMRARRGRIPAAECVTFGVELARVLAGLHARGLVHRDIKPSNVILVGGVPKLADIGLVTPASSARTFVGTEGFVPPEGPGSPRADVFALGKVLYELSTGLDRQQFPQFPPELNRLPDRQALLKLNEVVLRACDPLPERRYAEGRALLADLLTLQAGRPVRQLNPGRRLVLVAAAAVVALGLGWLGLRPPAAKPAPARQAETAPSTKTVIPVAPAFDKSLVVLPLENLNPDSADAVFADAMHAEIIATVGRIGELKVIARDTALTLKRGSATLAELARKVNVAHVITGSVQRQGQTVRIALELRRASDEAVLWSLPNRDREFKEVMALQAEIAEEVARALQARDAKGVFAAARFTTKDPQAYELFLKSQAAYMLEPRLMNENAMVHVEEGIEAAEEGIEAAKQALQLDPGYMSAASLLASHYVLVHQFHRDPADRLRYATEAKRWGEEAQRLAPGGAGDGALAHYYIIVENDYGRGLRFADNASRAFPNEATYSALAGMALQGLGRWEEALARFAYARSIDPANTSFLKLQLSLLKNVRRRAEIVKVAAAWPGTLNRNAIRGELTRASYSLFGKLSDNFEKTINGLYAARRFEESLALLDARLAAPLVPTTDVFLTLYGWIRKYVTLRRLDRAEEADAAARTVMALMEKLPLESNGYVASNSYFASTINGAREYPPRAWTFACAGRRDEAIAEGRRGAQALADLNRIESQWGWEVHLARIHAHFGQKRECVELLAKLLRVPSGITVPLLRLHPDWDNVREDPGFKKLLADPKNDAPL
jgi:TolB-like protein